MPLGLGGRSATNDPFYSMGRFQNDKQFDWTKTPVIGGPAGFIERNPEGAFNRFLTGNFGVGLGDDSAYANYLRDQFRNTQLGFKSAIAEDPTLTYQNYLKGIGAQPLQTRWAQMTPIRRGENWSRFAGPMRTIADL